MKHTVTIEFNSVYPLSVDEWNNLKLQLCAQITEDYKLYSVGIVSETVNDYQS